MDDSGTVAEVERLRKELQDRDGIATRMAAKARRLEDAIALHRRRKTGQADDVAFLDPSDIDALLWQELEPTDERHLLGSA